MYHGVRAEDHIPAFQYVMSTGRTAHRYPSTTRLDEATPVSQSPDVRTLYEEAHASQIARRRLETLSRIGGDVEAQRRRTPFDTNDRDEDVAGWDAVMAMQATESRFFAPANSDEVLVEKIMGTPGDIECVIKSITAKTNREQESYSRANHSKITSDEAIRAAENIMLRRSLSRPPTTPPRVAAVSTLSHRSDVGSPVRRDPAVFASLSNVRPAALRITGTRTVHESADEVGGKTPAPLQEAASAHVVVPAPNLPHRRLGPTHSESSMSSGRSRHSAPPQTGPDLIPQEIRRRADDVNGSSESRAVEASTLSKATALGDSAGVGKVTAARRRAPLTSPPRDSSGNTSSSSDASETSSSESTPPQRPMESERSRSVLAPSRVLPSLRSVMTPSEFNKLLTGPTWAPEEAETSMRDLVSPDHRGVLRGSTRGDAHPPLLALGPRRPRPLILAPSPDDEQGLTKRAPQPTGGAPSVPPATVALPHAPAPPLAEPRPIVPAPADATRATPEPAHAAASQGGPPQYVAPAAKVRSRGCFSILC